MERVLLQLYLKVIGTYVSLNFTIDLHIDDVEILHKIVKNLGFRGGCSIYFISFHFSVKHVLLLDLL